MRSITSFVLASLVALALLSCDSSGGGTGDPGQDISAPPEDTQLTGQDVAAEDVVSVPDTQVVDVPAQVDVPVVPDIPVVPDVPEDVPTVVDTADAIDGWTGATPDPTVLTSEHSGWQEAKCWDCHEPDHHNEALDPYLCADCHGRNGAEDGHTSDNCSECHSGQHGGTGFPIPLSCRVCHPE